jgi:sugar O-acyltransferase (sialic acid O-acetyltransferase NeuD family)
VAETGVLVRLVIIGAGGHAREVLDVVDARNAVAPAYAFEGFVARDHGDTAALARRGARLLGDESVLAELGRSGELVFNAAIGDPAARARVVEAVPDSILAATLVHPAAVVDSAVLSADGLGGGSMVPAGALVEPGGRLGRHVHLNVNAVVGEGAILGDFATLSPGSVVGRGATVGERALIGAGAVVADGVRIGDDAVVGAGAAVEDDVSPGATVVGRPAH